MTDLTFAAGQRATLDLRESAGMVALKDWDEPSIRVTVEGEAPPFVTREDDIFRLRLPAGGTITLPAGMPAEVLVPPAVQLRLMRVMRAGGETTVRPVVAPGTSPGESAEQPAGAGAGAGADGPTGAAGTPDFAQFAKTMSEHGRRILEEMAAALRASGVVASEDASRRLEEAAKRLDEQAWRVAERLQHDFERAFHTAERAQEHARRAAERAEERARRIAERMRQRQGHRWWSPGPGVEWGASARAGARAGRSRWWFTEAPEEPPAPAPGAAGPGHSPPGSAAAREERLAILQLLQEGKITPDQASRLLEALGG